MRDLILPVQPHVGGPPYRGSAMKSAYHVRELEVYRLMKLRGKLDIFLSHDWPTRIAFAGNTEGLLRRKAFLRSEVLPVRERHGKKCHGDARMSMHAFMAAGIATNRSG